MDNREEMISMLEKIILEAPKINGRVRGFITTQEFIHQNDNCKDSDGEFDSKKRYQFSYKKLLKDDRLQSTFHASWIDKLKEHDGEIVSITNEEEGTLSNGYSVSRNWCNELV